MSSSRIRIRAWVGLGLGYMGQPEIQVYIYVAMSLEYLFIVEIQAIWWVWIRNIFGPKLGICICVKQFKSLDREIRFY